MFGTAAASRFCDIYSFIVSEFKQMVCVSLFHQSHSSMISACFGLPQTSQGSSSRTSEPDSLLCLSVINASTATVICNALVVVITAKDSSKHHNCAVLRAGNRRTG